ncbi:hypothetical protein Q5752_000661 [Cryptotrichosporon argae]
MGTTLHPFRYITIARYVFQRLLESSIPRRRVRPRPVVLPASRRATILDSRDEHTLSASAGAQAGPSTPSASCSAPSASSGKPQHPDPTDPPRPDATPDPRYPPEPKDIYRLMGDEHLFVPGAMKTPREIVVLCHGLYGFSTATPIPLFPSLKLHYWANVLEVLRDRMGVKVVVVGVNGTGSIKERAEQMHAYLKSYLPRGVGVNFVAHSMGGLDCRHLISTIRPTEYQPLSLTTIATPHRGSPFMDWCAANIGVGTPEARAAIQRAAENAKSALPFTLKTPLLARPEREKTASDTLSTLTSALTGYLLNIFDSPAYSNLTTAFLRDHFNPATPDDARVKYFSVAGRINKLSVLHPLWFPKLVLDSAAEKGYGEEGGGPGRAYEGNDGLVSVSSAKWGEFLGVVDGCHHWDMRGEGGLWPQGVQTSARAEPRPDPAKPGGWDWGDGDANGDRGSVDRDLGLGRAQMVDGKRPVDPQMDPATHARDLETARAMTKSGSGGLLGGMVGGSGGRGSDGSWDLAQVGQLIDWVGDLFPGDKRESEPTKQLADATREKEKEDGQAGAGGGNDSGSGKKDGDKKAGAKDKFDLARFYGGLMLRLREEGL